jgi:hypothetical protein
LSLTRNAVPMLKLTRVGWRRGDITITTISGRR